MKHEGLGSKPEPAASCGDLFRLKPTLVSGTYFPLQRNTNILMNIFRRHGMSVYISIVVIQLCEE